MTSAVPLTDEQKDKLVRYLEGEIRRSETAVVRRSAQVRHVKDDSGKRVSTTLAGCKLTITLRYMTGG